MEYLVERLAHADGGMRASALNLVSKLDAHILDRHVSVLFSMLSDNDEKVREAVVSTMTHLQPHTLVSNLEPLLKLATDDENSEVRGTIYSEILDELDVDVRARSTVTSVLIVGLKDDDAWVRECAVKALGGLAPENLAKHVTDVLPMLKDEEEDVRIAAVETLGCLPDAELGSDSVNENLLCVKSTPKHLPT